LSEGGGEFVDVIGYHFYVAPQPPEATVVLATKIKRLMADAGISGKPIWNTEAGWFLPKPFPSELAAAYVVRDFVLNWAAGIHRLYWYAWDNHGWVTLETTQSDSETLTPAGRAYGVAYRWLVGARMLQCAEDQAHTWICELDRQGNRQRIVWNVAGSRTFTIPAEWHAKSYELVSGEPTAVTGAELPIGPAPVLISSDSPQN
jgi:hypothetical protein